jgi:hypothetical protein
MKKTILALSTLSVAIFMMSSCSKDKTTDTPVYSVPTAYNFTNVSDSNQIKLLTMADQLVAKINTANSSPNTVVTAQSLLNMFNNSGAPFTDSVMSLNASGLKLADYCPAGMKADLISYFDSIEVYSNSSAAAANGVAGVAASSVTATKRYLLSPNGVFYSQIVKKAIMGMCAYQIANVYLKDSVTNTIDNSTVVPGQGTAMEHNWDQAFGFFGVPIDFPTNVKGVKYFGSYSNQVNAGMNSNTIIMNAFLKGRAAISGKDLATKDAQAALLIATMDVLDAACIVQEMHETNTNLEAGDAVAAYGTLSESLGFIRNLRYNTSATRKITDAQITQLLSLIDSNNPNNPNLYNFVSAGTASTADIEVKTNAIAQLIGTIYGFSQTQLGLL